MLIILLLLLLSICNAGPTYRECTQCNYIEQPKPFSADVNAISDRSFDSDCVGAGYTDFQYCLKKACNRDGDNSWNNFLHYPCEKYIPSVCPDCGEHGKCINVTKMMFANGYCTKGLNGPIDVRNAEACAERYQYFVLDKDHHECYEMSNMHQCDRGGSNWIQDNNYDSYVFTHTCACDDGWSGVECKENDLCCEAYSAECLGCKAGLEPWEFCSNLLNVPPYNVHQASELGCDKILESKAGITGLQYKHLSFVCDGPSDDASASWKVDGETCADFGRKIQGTDIWRCAASGHMDFSNHQLPVPNDVCCTCGYKIPTAAVDCIGQWTDKGHNGEDCGTYIVTTPVEGEGLDCSIVAGTVVACSQPTKDCVGVWTQEGPKGDQCGKFIITQIAQGGGQPCLSQNGAERECSTGEQCRLTGGEQVKDRWSGLDTGDNYCNTCSCNDGVLLCTLIYCDGARPCTLTDGTTVAPGWVGRDTGDNYCNTCQCKDGNLLCTKVACPSLCPIPGCIAPPEDCVYVKNEETNEDGCPKFPCGVLECNSNHHASVERMYMTRDQSMVTLYYSGAKPNSVLGIVTGLQYSRPEDIPLASRHIIDKKLTPTATGHVTLSIGGKGGPFFATMWNANGSEVSDRVLFDKFSPEFLARNCPKTGEADRQFPWDDALSMSGGRSHSCADYGTFSPEDQDWMCNMRIAGWDTDRDFSTAVNTCCACDGTGSLYHKWANENGINPYSCDIQCPYHEHFHSIMATFRYMQNTNTGCDTVHMRSCGGETVWSPCSGPTRCKYTPVSPSATELAMIEMGTKLFLIDLNTFTDAQWVYIWALQNETRANKDELLHLREMHDKIDRMAEIREQLSEIEVPERTESNNQSCSWLQQLIDKAGDDLLYRDLTTYPRLIERLHEISKLIESGNPNAAREIRHAMRYDLTVLIEDVNTIEQNQAEINEKQSNRTTNVELKQEDIIQQLWELEQSHIGLSTMVQSEIAYIRKELVNQSTTDEQIFARLTELSLVAALHEEQLYNQSVRDVNHAAGIEALIAETELIRRLSGENMTDIQRQLDSLTYDVGRVDWKLDDQVEAIAWQIHQIKKEVEEVSDETSSRLKIMEDAYADTAEQLGITVMFLDDRINQIYDAVLTKADAGDLNALELLLYDTEIELKDYADIQGAMALNHSLSVTAALEKIMYDKFNEIGEVPTLAEIQLMIKQSYDEGLAKAEEYADAVAAEAHRAANQYVEWMALQALDQAAGYADQQAEAARQAAATFAQSKITEAIDALSLEMHAKYQTADDVRDIVVDTLWPIFHDNITMQIESVAQRERDAMFLSLEQRASQLEYYASVVAEAAATQARINATNTAVFLVSELRNELHSLNASMQAEFAEIHIEIPNIKQMIHHLNCEINIVQDMIVVIEQDIIANNASIRGNEQEVALVKQRVSSLEQEVATFRDDVLANYVKQDTFDSLRIAFEIEREKREQQYTESNMKFAQVEATVSSLETQTSMLFVTQEQKILFIQEELDYLKLLHGEQMDSLQSQLSVLNKIQEDYPSVDLSNQVSQLHAEISIAGHQILENEQRLLWALGNVSETATLLESLTGDVNEQRAALVELESNVLYGDANASFIYTSITDLQQQIEEKIDRNELEAAKAEAVFQRQQLNELEAKLEALRIGTDNSGLDLHTYVRVQQLENQIQALQQSQLICGYGNISYNCRPLIDNMLEQMSNITFNNTNNEIRLQEIWDVVTGNIAVMSELRRELETMGATPGSTVSSETILEIQDKITEHQTYIEQFVVKNNEYDDRIAYVYQEMMKFGSVTMSNKKDYDELRTEIEYFREHREDLPQVMTLVEELHRRVDRLTNTTLEHININRALIEGLEQKVASLEPELNVLGATAEALRLELTQEMAALRNAFLDLPDSTFIQELVDEFTEHIQNLNVEVANTKTEQQHFMYQLNKLDTMRLEIDHLKNQTAQLFETTLNATHALITNSSLLDPNIDATLAPLLRRIDVLESVVNAHSAMNFSVQIDSIYETINTRTEEIVQLLHELRGNVELTETQLDDIAKRVANLNPTQEVLSIRDELNRLTELERIHPLVNLSTEISSLNQRVSAFETMLPPATLEAILEDIALLKQKIQCSPFCPSEGEILIIQDQIKLLMDAASNHSEAIEGLETLAELLENSASDRDTKLAEIEIELDTLEHAITTVINNGNVLNLGIPTIVSELEEDNRETRELVAQLAAKVDELKSRLRYYSTCLHSRDCRPGQRCDKHSECQWSPGSIVCAWEKLHCADKCHDSGDCHMMKHVWKKEYKSQECSAAQRNCSDFILDNDDLNITLLGPRIVELILGQNVSTYKDPGALCTDARWRYDIKTTVVPSFNPKLVGDYNWTYDCNGKKETRTVRVRYPLCDPNYYITCPDGSRAFQRKEFLCTVACPSSGYDCHKDRYAGPACKCSPITGACMSFYGDIEATWDGEYCGCKCRSGVKLINNNCV
jgi:hypothetical protein